MGYLYCSSWSDYLNWRLGYPRWFDPVVIAPNQASGYDKVRPAQVFVVYGNSPSKAQDLQIAEKGPIRMLD